MRHRKSNLSQYLLVLSALTLTLLTCSIQGPAVDLTDQQSVAEILRSEMKRQEMTSLAFAVVKDDQLLWVDAYGFADRDKKIAATSNTRYLVASISKVVCALSIMQLSERGQLNLHDDVNTLAPFEVRNPRYPDVPITIAMLLNHTSSICDEAYWDYQNFCYGFDSPLSLAQYYGDFFNPGGQFYSLKSFRNTQPGTVYEYSNAAHALLALVVERISGIRYDIYCKQHIFDPLGMTRTTFKLAQTPLEELAVPYPGAPPLENRNPHYTWPTYPDGGLRTNVVDLSRLLRVIIMDGTLDGVTIAKPETIGQMKNPTRTFTDGNAVGLTLNLIRFNGIPLIGHSGGQSGVSTYFFYNPQSRTGFVLLNNDSHRFSETAAMALLRWGEAH